jgi:predicted ATPase
LITRIWVKNYRSLADVDIQLEPLTVLVGPNGSGKSNLVDVLRFVSGALQHGLDAAVVDQRGMSALRRWSAKGRPYDVEIGLGLKTAVLDGEYRFTLGSERRGEYRVKTERCLVRVTGETKPEASDIWAEAWHGWAPGEAGFETNNGKWVREPPGAYPAIQPTALVLPLLTGLSPFKTLYDFLTGMSFYNILPTKLTEPQKPANPYPLDKYGENLATVLRELKLNRKDAVTDLERALSSVMGDVQGYQVSQVGGYLVTKLRHAAAAGERAPLFELAQESDGTLRMLGILAVLYQDPPRTLIGLEEPELAIHPGAMSLLWAEIQDAAQRSQIIITTHSPDLLDLCQAEQLRVVEKIDGVTYVAPVEEAQKQIIKKRLFAPGQLLRAQGLHRAAEI